jgi:hypothetical protein
MSTKPATDTNVTDAEELGLGTPLLLVIRASFWGDAVRLKAVG